MSPLVETLEGLPERFPRVSGDEPFRDEFEFTATQFSPRERG